MRAEGLVPALFAVLAAASFAAACAAPRDTLVPEAHDVHLAVDAPAAPVDGGAGEAYLHVARRSFATVGLADARGIDPRVASAATEKLADALSACAADLAKSGKLAPGAARLVAQLDDNGGVAGTKLTTSPGAGVTANALLCFVSPMKLLAFPAESVDAGTRGLAVEATWGEAEGHEGK